MDAGVGTAGALGQDAFADGAVDGVGEESLDGGQAGLDLPAVVRGAVVGEDELPVSHAVICTVSRVESPDACCLLVVKEELYAYRGWVSGLERGGLLYLAFGEWRRTSASALEFRRIGTKPRFRFVAKYAASRAAGIAGSF